MSFRLPWQAGTFAILLAAGLNLRAQTAPAGSPPGVQPASSAISTNSNRTTRRDGLRYLEEELSRSLQFLSRGSLDSVLAAPPMQHVEQSQTVVSRPSKDEPDRGESWSTLDRAEQREPGRASDPFKLPGKNRTDRRRQASESYYERLNQNRETLNLPGSRRSTQPSTTRFSSDRLKDQNSNDDQLPGAIREKERTLREKLFGTDSTRERIFNPGETLPGTLSGMFNPEERGLSSRAEAQERQDYLDRYRQVLSGPTPAVNPLSLPQLPQSSFSTLPAQALNLGASDPYATPIRDNSARSQGELGSLLSPARLPDLDSKALNRWNPLYQAPAVEPSKPLAAQPPPFMEPPRRRF